MTTSLSITSAATPLTRAEALEFIIDDLKSKGFTVDEWQDGEIQKSLVYAFASMFADLSQTQRATAAFGSSETATGVPLTLLSKSRFDNTRDEGRRTRGYLQFTNATPTLYTGSEGALLARSDNGVEFRCVEAWSIAGNTTTPVLFEATLAGAIGNVASGTIRTLTTPLAGVTITNSGSPWYTISGQDPESDTALKARNATKWSRLSVELIASAYESIAREFGARKVTIDQTNPRGPGTLDVYCAADNALLSSGELTAIQEALASRTWQTGAAWPALSTDRCAVKSPSTYGLDVTAILYHDGSANNTTVIARASAALTRFLASTPIGGWDYSPGPANVILVSDLHEILQAVEGVVTVALTTPATTLSVPVNRLVVEGTFNFSAVVV